MVDGNKDGSTLRYVKNLKTTYFVVKSYLTTVTYLNLIFEAYRTLDLKLEQNVSHCTYCTTFWGL